MDGEEELCIFPSFPVLEAHKVNMESCVIFHCALETFPLCFGDLFSAPWRATLCAYKRAEVVCLAQQAAQLSPFNNWSFPTWHYLRAGNAKLTQCLPSEGAHIVVRKPVIDYLRGWRKRLREEYPLASIIRERLLSSVWDFSKGNDPWVSLSWRRNSKYWTRWRRIGSVFLFLRRKQRYGIIGHNMRTVDNSCC